MPRVATLGTTSKQCRNGRSQNLKYLHAHASDTEFNLCLAQGHLTHAGRHVDQHGA